MKYVIIPIVAGLLIFIVKVLLRTARTIRQTRKDRKELFELVATDWINLINQEITFGSIYRDPGKKPIREMYFKEGNYWIASIPLLNDFYPDGFDMLLVATPITDPKPQIKTIVWGLIVTTDPKSWWVPNNNTPILHGVMKQLKSRGLIFDVAEPKIL